MNKYVGKLLTQFIKNYLKHNFRHKFDYFLIKVNTLIDYFIPYSFFSLDKMENTVVRVSS